MSELTRKKIDDLSANLVDQTCEYVRHNPRTIVKMIAALTAAMGGVVSTFGGFVAMHTTGQVGIIVAGSITMLGGAATTLGVVVERWLSDSTTSKQAGGANAATVPA